jgi:hypothetical protein
MEDLLANPRGLIIIACFGAMVVGLNLTLFGLLRGDKSVQREAAVWGKVLRGNQASQRQQAQLDELHQRVADLQRPPTPPDEH